MIPSANYALGAKCDMLSQKRDLLEINLGGGSRSSADSSESPLLSTEGGSTHHTSPIRDLAAYRHAPRSTARVQPRSIGPKASPPVEKAVAGSAKAMTESILPTSRRGNRTAVLSSDTLSGHHPHTLVIDPQNHKGGGDLFADLPLLDEDRSGVASLPVPPTAASSRASDRATPSLRPSPAPGLAVSTPADDNGASGGARGGSFLSRMFSAEKSCRGDATGLTPADTARSPYIDDDHKDSVFSLSSPAHSREIVPESPVVVPKPIFFDTPLASALKKADTPDASSAAPVLTKEGYVTYPSMQVLRSMTDEELSCVYRFRISRRGVGSIEWEGNTDLRSLNLDELVDIDNKSIAVYEDVSSDEKPQVGVGLNKPAVLTLCDIYPGDKSASQDMYFAFEEKLKKVCKKRSADFRSYDIETGEWSFRVACF
jgi:hypothetical protein